jgi:PPOX class probable F420-dependent enzyme
MHPVLQLSEFVVELATGGNPAYFATVNADGAPQVTPVWVDYEDGHLLVDTVIGSLKERNVRRDPRVAITIQDKDRAYKKADIRGEVVEFIEGDPAIAQMDVLAQRYLGMDRNPWAVPGQRRVIMKITPIRAAEAEYDPHTGGRSER